MKGEALFSYIVMIAGFIFFCFNLHVIGFILLIVGFGLALKEIWKSPINGVYLTIFFLPLTKTFVFPIVGSKLSLPDLLFISTLAIYFIQGKINFKKLFDIDKYKIYFLGSFLLFNMISVMNATSLHRWFSEIMTYFFLSIFFLFMIYALDDNKKIEKALLLLTISVSISISLGFLGYILRVFTIYDNPFVQGYRLTSTFKVINQMTMSLIVGFYLIAGRAQNYFAKGNSRLDLSFLFVAMIGIFTFLASGTRIIIFILVPILSLYVIFYPAFLSKKKFPAVPIILLILTIGFIYAPIELPEQQAFDRTHRYLQDLSFMGEADSFSDFLSSINSARFYQLDAFKKMFALNPIIGVGSGNFKTRMLDYGNYPKAWEMHNTFLGVLAESGLLGFFSLLGFLILIAWGAIRNFFTSRISESKNQLFLLAIGLSSHFMFSMFHFGLRNRHLWLGLALLVILSREK